MNNTMKDLSTNELISILANASSCAITAPSDDEVDAARAEFHLRVELGAVQARVDAGDYDSLYGQRPEAFVDRDGDVAVAYPASGDRGSMPWEIKVSNLNSF